MSDDPVIMTRSMDEPDIYACITAMLVQEHHYLCHDYLNLSSRQPAHYNMTYGRCDPIDETCRSKMSEWCFHVVDCTNLRRETVSIAMGYLDRFLCTSSHRAEQARCDRKEYQLAAMTALYVAVKIFEPLEMDAGLVSKLSRGLHSAAEITRLEHEMLVALNWRMNCPSPYQICNFLLELLPETAQDVKPTLYDYCHFQTELATGDYAYVPLRRSVIAVASVLNALEGIDQQDLLIPDRMTFINSISRAVDFDICSPVVNAVRMRLLESFAKSSGFALPQAGLIPVIDSKPAECDAMFIGDETCLNCGKVDEFGESPVCISREMAISLGTDMHSSWDHERNSI
ncbi:hypothetical protein ACHAW6_011886 [Cyclotella cf. meneghiniana]